MWLHFDYLFVGTMANERISVDSNCHYFLHNSVWNYIKILTAAAPEITEITHSSCSCAHVAVPITYNLCHKVPTELTKDLSPPSLSLLSAHEVSMATLQPLPLHPVLHSQCQLFWPSRHCPFPLHLFGHPSATDRKRREMDLERLISITPVIRALIYQ